MQNSFGPLDSFKLAALLEEGIAKLNFLNVIQKEDEASSELAGYEINKLLSEQSKLEARYEELLKIRSHLTGISNKRKLEQVQKEIGDVANALKESTKKLCRLFRSDPDFASDAQKIERERSELRDLLEQLMTATTDSIQSFQGYQGNIYKELENQDLLRKLMQDEKKLNNDIKQLHQLWKQENQEYQNEQQEKQKLLQRNKEKFVKHKTKAQIETTYKEKEIKADEGMEQRLNNQRLTDLEQEIKHFEDKKQVEIDVFNQISIFLKEKENHLKKQEKDLLQKTENSEAQMDHEISKQKSDKEKLSIELEELRKRYDFEELEKREKERRMREAEEEKRRKQEEEERLENGIKMIQDYYMAFKEKGGVFGKKKKKKKKKKS